MINNSPKPHIPPTFVDSEYYLSIYPDVFSAGLSALNHYFEYGWKENRSPNPLFDPYFYLSQIPEAINIPALIHYLDIGASSGLNPHPLFDTNYYLNRYTDSYNSGLNPLVYFLDNGLIDLHSPHPLFDAHFYQSQLSSIESSHVNALCHYLKSGWRRGLDPHPLFDTEFYMAQAEPHEVIDYPALIHYLKYGAPAGRRPHLLFDPSYYRDQAGQVVDPLTHYLIKGWRLGFNPHPLFDSSHYIAEEKEAENIDYPSLIHYLKKGAPAGRSPHPLFDPSYYRKQAGNVTDPLKHYVYEGWRLGYNPHPKFDSKLYLKLNTDVANAGVIPLAHFVIDGANEGRSPSRELSHAFMLTIPSCSQDPRWRKILEINPPPTLSLSSFLLWRYQKTDSSWVLNDPRLKTEFLDSVSPSLPSLNSLVSEINSLANTLRSKSKVDVSIIVPVHNNIIHTLSCLRSILLSGSRYSFEVLISDDASDDATTSQLSGLNSPIFRVLRNSSALGFLRNCNNAASQANGDWLVLLNNDTIALPGWLDELIGTLSGNPKIGLAGAKLLFPDGTLQECGGAVWKDATAWNIGRSLDPCLPQFSYQREVDYCSGAAIALPKSLWQKLGGFDDRYSPAYYEDTDLAFRVREAGYKVVVQPLACVIHFEGVSHGKDASAGIMLYQEINRQTFLNRWKKKLPEHLSTPKELDQLAFNPLKKTVLVVDAETPRTDQDSGSNDTYQYIRALLQFGFHVIFVAQNCLYLGRYTQDLLRLGVECHYLPYARSLQQIVRDHGSRIVAALVFRYYVAQEVIPSLRKLSPNTKIIFETVDLHFLRETRQGEISNDSAKTMQAENTKLEELAIIKEADASILLSQHEMGLIRKLQPRANLHCIPILRDIPPFKAIPLQSRTGLMFLGSFRHPPNVDGICWFVEKVWPLLINSGFNSTLTIVGADPPDEVKQLATKNIHVLGYVECLDHVFATCRATIAPLRYGAGLKGKVISSLSYGVPCISTEIGIEGSGLKHQQDVLVADSPEEMVTEIIRLFESDYLWQQLSDNGLTHFKKEFSIEAVFPKIKKLLQNLDIHAGQL